LPPFGNLSNEEMDTEEVVIDKDYNHISDMVGEDEVIVVLTLENNLKKVH
jgi:hypothetical protein